MKKRLFSVFLALCMILTMAPAAFAAEQEGGEVPVTEGSVTESTTGEEQAAEPENVAEVDGTKYATLAAAVDAVIESDGNAGTVTLLKDASGGGIGLFHSEGAKNVNLTIDFDGFTYTCEDPAVGSTGTESQGFHFEKGNTVTLKNGTVKVDPDSSNTKMLIQNYCNLTLENMTLEGADVTQYLISSNYGDVTLKNVNAKGTYTGNGGVVAIDLMHWLNDSYRDKAPTMTIENSAKNEIMGTIDLYCYGTGSDTCEDKPTLTIKGGTYSSDVSEYLAEGLGLSVNGDGTYTVGTLEAGNAAAEVNGKYYNTLAEAIDNAEAGQTVKALKDQTFTETQTISEGITLDLGGTTLTIAGSHTDAGISIAQDASAETPISVTIQNGTITDVRGKDKSALGANTIFVEGAVNLTTRDLTVQAYAPAGENPTYYNYLLRISPSELNGGGSAKVGSLTLERGTKLEELENGEGVTPGVVGVTAIGAYTSSAASSIPENYEGVKVVIKDGVSIETTGFALSGNGANHGTTFVIEGGSLVSTGSTGIYHPQQGKMTITGNPVISGKEAGIELRAGEMTVNGGTISGQGTPTEVSPNGNGTTSSGVGIAVAQHTTKLPIKVTISGGTISGFSAFYESNPQGNSTEDLAKIKLLIEGGAFKATNGGSVAVHSEDVTGFITGGTFSSNPSDYLADSDSKIAVVQNGMYTIQEKNTDTPAEVVPGEPEADVSAIPQEQQEAVKEAVAGIKADGLTGEANGHANQNKVTKEDGESALSKAGVSVAGETVTIVVQPYLDITAKAVSETEMLLEITPMVRTVATTDSSNIVMEDGNEKNAVQMGSDKKLDITTNITLEVPLPTGFNIEEANPLFVEHIKDDGRTYVYKATVTEAGGVKTATFTTTRGFSTFRLVTEDISVAEVDGTYFSTLQAAVDDVHNGGTIKLTKDASGTVTVNREVVFTIDNGTYNFDPSIVSTGSGYTLSRDGNTFTVKTASSSGGGGGSSSTSYTITVNDTKGGTVKVSPTRASKGSTVTITATPDEGYKLSSLTVTDKNGDKVALTDKGENKYTFKMPASKVTVEATFTVPVEKPPFTDVSEGAYYYDAVLWAVEKGITTGTSDTTFSPDKSCTRAEMVTFLWRAAGSPAASASNPFSDVSSGAYYYDAVLWAVAKGITTGTSATTFSPDAIVSRGQTVTFLYRANGSPAATGSNPFTDVPAGAYYTDAVLWAVSEDVTNGTSSTTFSPDTDCSRGQIVTFLYRSMA